MKYDSVGFLTEDTVFVSDISSSKYQICFTLNITCKIKPVLSEQYSTVSVHCTKILTSLWGKGLQNEHVYYLTDCKSKTVLKIGTK